MADLSASLIADRYFRAGRTRLPAAKIPELFETLNATQAQFRNKQDGKKPDEDKLHREEQKKKKQLKIYAKCVRKLLSSCSKANQRRYPNQPVNLKLLHDR